MTGRQFTVLTAAASLVCALAGTPARAQVICPATEVTSGLQRPLGITQSNQENLIVSETGTRAANSGRLSIVDQSGNRRTLVDALPSAISDVGDPSGPAGVFMRGRTLYVVISVGDVGRRGPLPGTTIPNPNPLSSPLFSSILAIHFSADVEHNTQGFTLSADDHEALALGHKVTLSNDDNEKIIIELVADFPNYVSLPLPIFPGHIQLSNPFDVVAVGNLLSVTDGGRNLVWKVDIATGVVSEFANFPPISNPLFPSIGGPLVDAVPTGIAYSEQQLLVTLFRGVPFAPGMSVVEQIDPTTGEHEPFITALRTAIDVLPINERGDTDYLVLQHNSGNIILPPFSGPGVVLRFEEPDEPPIVIANCLSRPTSMTLDQKTGTLYVAELLTGRVIAIAMS